MPLAFTLHRRKAPLSFVSNRSPHGLFTLGGNSICSSFCWSCFFLLGFCFLIFRGMSGGMKSVSVDDPLIIIVGRGVVRCRVVVL